MRMKGLKQRKNQYTDRLVLEPSFKTKALKELHEGQYTVEHLLLLRKQIANQTEGSVGFYLKTI